MSYRVNRALGYQPWGVTNPWVFADLSQPQRLRGGVSPIVYKTHGYYLRSPHLGQVAESVPEETARARRMEKIAIVGLAISTASFALFASMQYRLMKKNARRRRRRR